MIEKSQAENLLHTALADDTATFRTGQWDAIDTLVNERKKLFLVQRTGWGKSNIYFIATKLLKGLGYGPTLIVSPLLSLMRNQIEAAARFGIRVDVINSTNQEEWCTVQQSVLQNNTDALLISPERLANEEFINNILQPISVQLGLLVVDEAHCISDWGHDFRPDYRRIVNVLRRIPDNTPILGTTATANERVIKDVTSQLGNIEIQRGPLMRESIALQTMHLDTQAERLAWLADHINELPGTGIIYTLTKHDADQVAKWLQLNRISAKAYYSDVVNEQFDNSNSYRQYLEDQLLHSEVKALVATTALGMGYDKPDLGFVIHYQAPSSIVAYYQQVGRAGRATDYAVAVLMSGNEDSDIHEYFRSSAFPSSDWVKTILKSLENTDGLSIRELEVGLNLRYGQIKQVLKYLSVENPAPLIKDGYKYRRTAVPYEMDHDRISRLTAQREIEWKEVQKYIDHSGCLMQFLACALDDTNTHACGKCASCLNQPVIERSFSIRRGADATRFLRKAEFELKPIVQIPKGGFPEYGFSSRFEASECAEKGRVLSRWGDAGWGRVVAEGKHNGSFEDDLVLAAMEMIQKRWQPSPFPQWITCIPSNRYPHLVPSFAKRLANKMSIPYVSAVTKVKDNEPQKFQQNRCHQCRNLDGVFVVKSVVLDTPVLLIDDIVDSKWTLMTVAALLRRSGSGPVYPFALASSAART